MPSTLERIALGDRAAVTECIDAYSGLVWSLSHRFLRNHADAEEAVQEIFMELWQKADSFDSDVAAEATFVSMIARRRLIDKRRKLSREPESQPFDEVQHAMSDEGQRVLESSVEAQRVLAVIETLKPEQQEVINMSTWLGMSHGAIAEKTGIPLGTVKSSLSRGLKIIRNALGERAVANKVST